MTINATPKPKSGASSTEDEDDAFVGVNGTKVTKSIKIARHMSARLSGISFNVEPPGFQEKEVTEASLVVWDWTVTPLEAGKEKLLTLEVYAHIVRDAVKSDGIRLKAYNEKIRVDVDLWNEFTTVFIEKIGPAHAFAVAIIGSAWGLFLWWRKRQSHPKAAAQDEERAAKDLEK